MRGPGGRSVSAAAVTVMLAACNGVFYQPDARRYSTLPARAEDVFFASRDGTQLHGWFLPARGEVKGTVVHMHGNAQNLTSHVAFVDWLPEAGLNVFVFDYRGYGQSAGSPSRSGVFDDACAALDHVLLRADVDPARIVVFGQSLGGAIAAAALGEGGTKGVRGLVLDSAFASYITMGNEVLGGTFLTYPLAWLLLSDGHAPEDSIAEIAPVPILFLHGIDDPVVPLSEGRRLFDAAAKPKEFVELPQRGHTTATGTVAGRELFVRFVERCLRPAGP